MERSSAVAQASRRELGEHRPLRVLVVEDTVGVSNLIAAALRAEAMLVEEAATGLRAIACKESFSPDIVLVDLGLPDMDGIELVQRFAQDGDCGVIVVTASDSEATRIAGLERGADDYVVKPALLKELAARVRALHRRLARLEQASRSSAGPRTLLDAARRRLIGPGTVSTALTEAEFSALETLVEAEGVSVSREWLGRMALKRPITPDDRSIDQLVLKLRRKLALHGLPERAIMSSRGLGYIVPEPDRFIVSQPKAGQDKVGQDKIAQPVAAREDR